jgi:uncharacterized membrane protein
LKLNLLHSKALLIVLVAVLAVVLVVASPAIQKALVYPQTEFYTEFWLLGPNQKAENYPYNITANSAYTVYLGISNHLGSPANYQVEVKFRNQTQIGPSSINFTCSPQPSLYSFDVSVENNQTLEMPVVFQLNYAAEGANVYFNQLTINNHPLSLNGYTSSWNSTYSEFFGKLIFELWIYNSTTSSYQYHQRYVDLKLNMTSLAGYP